MLINSYIQVSKTFTIIGFIVVEQATLTAEKKPLVLDLPYLGSKSSQTRAKLKKSLKNVLNCCK